MESFPFPLRSLQATILGAVGFVYASVYHTHTFIYAHVYTGVHVYIYICMFVYNQRVFGGMTQLQAAYLMRTSCLAHRFFKGLLYLVTRL